MYEIYYRNPEVQDWLWLSLYFDSVLIRIFDSFLKWELKVAETIARISHCHVNVTHSQHPHQFLSHCNLGSIKGAKPKCKQEQN